MWLMSDEAVQLILRAGVPTLAIVAAIVIEGRQLKALRAHMDACFDRRTRRVEDVIDARLKHLEER